MSTNVTKLSTKTSKNQAYNRQSQDLNLYFNSIENPQLRQEIVNFMMKIGEAAGMEINHSAITDTLTSDEVFEGLFGKEW